MICTYVCTYVCAYVHVYVNISVGVTVFNVRTYCTCVAVLILLLKETVMFIHVGMHCSV